MVDLINLFESMLRIRMVEETIADSASEQTTCGQQQDLFLSSTCALRWHHRWDNNNNSDQARADADARARVRAMAHAKYMSISIARSICQAASDSQGVVIVVAVRSHASSLI